VSWKPESDEIERRRAQAHAQGGADAVAKQHARGRLTARERVAALCDPGSFREHGETAGVTEPDGSFAPANVVVGTASIDARLVEGRADLFTLPRGS